MTEYQQGMIEKLAQMGDLFGFGKQKKEAPAGAAIGGALGGAGGMAAGHKMMRGSSGAQKELMRAMHSKGNVIGKIMKTYGKRMIPLALVGTALGAITGSRIQEEI
jgi:hypothetical protein